MELYNTNKPCTGLCSKQWTQEDTILNKVAKLTVKTLKMSDWPYGLLVNRLRH